MEGWIGDSALTQLIHLIFATCMPWFRKDFAAPDGYSCNWFSVVSLSFRHDFRKAHANAPTSASPFAFCGQRCARASTSLRISWQMQIETLTNVLQRLSRAFAENSAVTSTCIGMCFATTWRARCETTANQLQEYTSSAAKTFLNHGIHVAKIK
jgi:hypothetical protein